MKTKRIAAPTQIDVTSESKREIVAIISTTSIDRDGEIVVPKGVDLTNYRRNPVVLFNHDPLQPIAKTLWIKAEADRLVAKYKMATTDFAEDIFALLRDGILSAHSIGFEVKSDGPPTYEELEFAPEWKSARNVIRSSELLEYSVVSIPANPDALVLAVKAVSPETIETLGWKKSCWKFSEPKPQPKIELPKPKYAKPYKGKSDDIARRIAEKWSPEELLAKLKGRA